ncbi:sodium:proton exchanger [Actinomadura livida]|uniref:Cation:H+ antiporter n=1 Tax=Actinomadura livida TaxID=79909 RepID=A0A7W7MVV1_9ACTN|nr:MULTISPECIES: sodium:proton exchanger [Actinomadura]MBB4772204.1 cation:H+ antiporter [Actinomadura catellatispora]GGU27660.1 sodium/calcium exchanger family protein [Actinomadura livida]
MSGEPSVREPPPVSRQTLLVRVTGTLVLALPAVVTWAGGLRPPVLSAVLIFGAGVLAAAILLMWAAETAQADMSGALAVALLALAALLPQYALDLYFAHAGATKPGYIALAAATMTGANRLLVGVGWALVVLAFALGVRRPAGRSGGGSGRHAARGTGRRTLRLAARHRIELGFLALATVLGFIPALTGEIGWYIAVVLIAVYVLYLVRLGRGARDDTRLVVGVPGRLVALPRRKRRVAAGAGFAAGALIVYVSTARFGDALVAAGTSLGVDEFLLVQWLAPVVSEAPLLLAAAMLAWRLRDADAIGTLLSGKVNQWTLLIALLPLAYRVGGGSWSLPLDSRQIEEVLLTAAQTVLGLALLIDLVFRRWEAAVLFVLFAVQFLLPGEDGRLVLSGVYLAIGFSVLIARYRELGEAMGTVVRPRPRRG